MKTIELSNIEKMQIVVAEGEELAKGKRTKRIKSRLHDVAAFFEVLMAEPEVHEWMREHHPAVIRDRDNVCFSEIPGWDEFVKAWTPEDEAQARRSGREVEARFFKGLTIRWEDALPARAVRECLHENSVSVEAGGGQPGYLRAARRLICQ